MVVGLGRHPKAILREVIRLPEGEKDDPGTISIMPSNLRFFSESFNECNLQENQVRLS